MAVVLILPRSNTIVDGVTHYVVGGREARLAISGFINAIDCADDYHTKLLFGAQNLLQLVLLIYQS